MDVITWLINLITNFLFRDDELIELLFLAVSHIDDIMTNLTWLLHVFIYVLVYVSIAF